MTLQRIVLPPRHRLRLAATATMTALALAGTAAVALHARPTPRSPVVAVLAPPPIFIAFAVPPAPPPVPVASLPPHVGCTADVSTIGVPLALAHGVADGAPPIKDLSVSREGCTIAVLVGTQLSVSWDGGTSFTIVDAGAFDAMVAVDGAVRLLRAGKELGTVGPGTIAWHPIPPVLATSTLIAAGSLSALAGDGLVGVTEDGGVTWGYIAVPKGVIVTRLDASGHLVGERILESPNGEDIVDYKATLYEADVGRPTWHRTGTQLGSPADELGRYLLRTDRFWGCGGTTKIVMRDGALVARDLRDDIAPVAVHSSARATFATLRERLVQLFATDEVDIAAMPEGDLIAVDATNLPIIRAQTRVLRWTGLGGWRVLFATQP